MSHHKRKKNGFMKGVAKGSAKGLGKLARGPAKGVVTELTAILSLGLYKPPWR